MNVAEVIDYHQVETQTVHAFLEQFDCLLLPGDILKSDIVYLLRLFQMSF